MLSYVEKLKEGVDEYVEWFYENYDNKLNRVDGGIDVGKIKIGSYIKSDIGENLKIVDKTFKNLKNNWFDGWEFNVLDKQLYCNHFSIDKNGKDRRYYDDKCNVDYGNFLEIKNDKVGRILLGEYEEDRFGDKYEFKWEVF